MRGSLRTEILRAHREVEAGVPGARSRLEGLQAEFRRGGDIVRVGGSCQLVEGRRPIARTKAASAKGDLSYGLPYTEVELLERGFADFTVDVGSGARETILGEIQRAHRETGDVEVGGWLFSQGSLHHHRRFVTVAYATLAGRGNATSVAIGEPLDGIEAARSAGIDAHWKLCGDWHCHPNGGSELPSHQDARAWAGVADSLARSCYVSLIVSPRRLWVG
jgi:hypothetical protein